MEEKVFVVDSSFLLDSLLIFLLAFLFDVVLGEIPDRIHPTLWMGKVTSRLKPKLRNKNPTVEKINGVLLCLFLVILFAAPAYIAIFYVHEFLGWLPYIIVSALILKSSFAIKCMRNYTLPVADAVEKKDYDRAKQLLPFIVRRNPEELTEQHILSAAVETIAEGTTDGVTSPFFYYALFGVPGAVAFRVINTLDSMVGYKDEVNINIGWFSAKTDTIVNYVPARLTGILMIVATFLLREDWKEAYRILQRDKNNMTSINAGWTIATMAGALNIQLEKPGYYKLGDSGDLKPAHIARALRIMMLTSILFGVVVVVPVLAVKAVVAARFFTPKKKA